MRFHPPSKEYLPPPTLTSPPHPSELPPDIDENLAPMLPPDQEYISPKSAKKITVNGVHYQLPTKEYLPPQQGIHHHDQR